ncbi:hypothetical protein AVEN_57860-1 [Araneus ventricosus]|uniref:Uncharacterized protein n=1 Tax=Araneus ventricosus TaxID=182803 RepID=A0A4Y2UED8_ARAVE|nr:hypothetical protein AVEN_57860-1 [Araneus ventricosus]
MKAGLSCKPHDEGELFLPLLQSLEAALRETWREEFGPIVEENKKLQALLEKAQKHNIPSDFIDYITRTSVNIKNTKLLNPIGIFLLASIRTVPIFDASENIDVTQSSPFRCLYCRFFSKHRKFRYNVSRCIIDIDVRKRAAFPRSSVYLSPCFFHRDLSRRHTLRSADHCADTMNPDVTANENDEKSSRVLRKRSVLSVVESLSHRNMLSSNHVNSLMLF